MKQIGIILGTIGAIALAVTVGPTLPTEAASVLIGVVCGVAAGIPTSVLLLVALSHRETRRGELRQTERGKWTWTE